MIPRCLLINKIQMNYDLIMLVIIFIDPGFSCTDGEIRLVDGLSANVGRVEICYDNHYGTICQNGWNQHDASVVCAQLGFEREGMYYLRVYVDVSRCVCVHTYALVCVCECAEHHGFTIHTSHWMVA